MKTISKKTIYRLSRMVGIQSARRVTNHLNCFLKRKTKGVHLIIKSFRRKNKLTPKEQGKKAHINQISLKLSLSNVNLVILKEFGYKPRKTKKKKKIVERIFDGYNCKTRRRAYLQLRYCVLYPS